MATAPNSTGAFDRGQEVKTAKGCIILEDEFIVLHKKTFGKNKNEIAEKYVAYELEEDRLPPDLKEELNKYSFDEDLITTCFYRYSHYDEYEGHFYNEVSKPARGVMAMWRVPRDIVEAWQDITSKHFYPTFF